MVFSSGKVRFKNFDDNMVFIYGSFDCYVEYALNHMLSISFFSTSPNLKLANLFWYFKPQISCISFYTISIGQFLLNGLALL